jgi:hypothetical protein
MWQDIIFTLGSIVFAVALLPSIRGKDKPHPATSLMTGGVLFIFALTYLSLELWFSASATMVTSTMWITLLIQEKRKRWNTQKK